MLTLCVQPSSHVVARWPTNCATAPEACTHCQLSHLSADLCTWLQASFPYLDKNGNGGQYCPIGQPSWSAFRQPIYGSATVDFINATHALYNFNRNQDSEMVFADSAYIIRDMCAPCLSLLQLLFTRSLPPSPPPSIPPSLTHSLGCT